MLCSGERITNKTIQKQIDQFNRLKNMDGPNEAWTNGQANVGYLYVDRSSTGYKLVRIINVDGGITSLTDRMPARQMYRLLEGMLLACDFCPSMP